MNVTVMSREPDPVTLKFSVCVDGWLEDWTLDRIKRAIDDGATLNERNEK
jgi:hypothetical protein